MPSVLVGTQSGGQLIISGNVFSGQGPARPQGGIQFRTDKLASGAIYVALSGNMTINSGTISAGGVTSGGGMDGMPVYAGDGYWLPRLACGMTSGSINVYAQAEAASSGNRLYFEIF